MCSVDVGSLCDHLVCWGSAWIVWRWVSDSWCGGKSSVCFVDVIGVSVDRWFGVRVRSVDVWSVWWGSVRVQLMR